MTTTHDVPMPEPDCGTIRVGYKDISLGYSEEAMRAYADARCAQESSALISLLADIRAAAGDPTGKLDWPGLVEHVAKLQAELHVCNHKLKGMDVLSELVDGLRRECVQAEAERDALAEKVKELQDALDDAYLDDNNADA